jgi:hypothetical protein
MSVINFNDLKNHVGHKIECVLYGNQNCSIECLKCNEVLIDFDEVQ